MKDTANYSVARKFVLIYRAMSNMLEEPSFPKLRCVITENLVCKEYKENLSFSYVFSCFSSSSLFCPSLVLGFEWFLHTVRLTFSLCLCLLVGYGGEHFFLSIVLCQPEQACTFHTHIYLSRWHSMQQTLYHNPRPQCLSPIESLLPLKSELHV